MQHYDRKKEDMSYEEPLDLPTLEGGGYYPCAVLGRRIAGRYQIVRKLGWASSSTVWLCLDTAAPIKTYVAVKILSGHGSAAIIGRVTTENLVFKRIAAANPHHPGFPHCLTIRNNFLIRSPVGPHICFATDVLGPHMGILRSAQPNQTFSVSVAKRIIKQVLLAVDYLHRECGYIHTDIRVDNVLAELPDTTAPQIDRYLEDHQSPTYVDSKLFRRVMKSQPLTDSNLDLRNLAVRLIDYGAASPVDGPLDDEFYQADIIRAPEITLGHSWSTPVDIWSIGCLLFELVANCHLFGQPGQYSADVHLQNMMEYLGEFPLQFLAACSRRDEYFDANGSLLLVNDFQPSSIEDVLYSIGTVQEEDVPCVAAFIRRCLALDPASRSSAVELLNDKWLNNM